MVQISNHKANRKDFLQSQKTYHNHSSKQILCPPLHTKWRPGYMCDTYMPYIIVGEGKESYSKLILRRNKIELFL